jgi:fatty acid desaturase
MPHRPTARTSHAAMTQGDVTFVLVAVALGAVLAYAVIWGAIGGYVTPTGEAREDAVHLARLGLGFAALLTVPVYSVWLIREAFDRAERAASRACARAAMQTATRLTVPGETPARLGAASPLRG